MNYPTIVFITEGTNISLFDAFNQWEVNSIHSIPNFKILNFEYISDINILPLSATEAILIHIYPSLESYYFIRHQNSEYWLIFDPIDTFNTLKKHNQICKKKIKKIIDKNKLLISENKLLISKNSSLIRRKAALNIEINVLLIIILCIIILLGLLPYITTSWKLSPFFNNIMDIFIHRNRI
jgi:hypothetical protein